jgi:hypothetical protein
MKSSIVERRDKSKVDIVERERDKHTKKEGVKDVDRRKHEKKDDRIQ